MATFCYTTSSFFILFLLHLFYKAMSDSSIGVNYGQVGNNLPTPEATVKLLQSTPIEKALKTPVTSSKLDTRTPKTPVTKSSKLNTPKTPVTRSSKLKTPNTSVTNSKFETTAAAWCVPKIGASDTQLQSNLDYACGQGIDCSPIQPGGACFEPNTLFSHAAYAMNLFYQTAGRNPWNCDFSQTAAVSLINPSYSGCTYPGGTTNDVVDLSKNSKVKTNSSKRPKNPVTSSKLETTSTAWCVPKIGTSDTQLQSNLDYACGQGIDCSPIQPGGACFEPNTLFSHATYAMNLFYQTTGRNPWNCDFSQTAAISVIDPSYSGCTYPGRNT